MAPPWRTLEVSPGGRGQEKAGCDPGQQGVRLEATPPSASANGFSSSLSSKSSARPKSAVWGQCASDGKTGHCKNQLQLSANSKENRVAGTEGVAQGYSTCLARAKAPGSIPERAKKNKKKEMQLPSEARALLPRFSTQGSHRSPNDVDPGLGRRATLGPRWKLTPGPALNPDAL